MNTIRHLAVLLIVHLVLVGPVGCTPTLTSDFQQLSAPQARSVIEKNEGNADFVILDVRTPREYKMGHIAGAELLDFHSPEFPRRLQELDKSKTYLIYCHTGFRSSRTLMMIEKGGFKTVYHLQRGIVAWYAGKLPLVKS